MRQVLGSQHTLPGVGCLIAELSADNQLLAWPAGQAKVCAGCGLCGRHKILKSGPAVLAHLDPRPKPKPKPVPLLPLQNQLMGVALSFLRNFGVLSGASGVLGALSAGVASAALDDRFAVQRAQQRSVSPDSAQTGHCSFASEQGAVELSPDTLKWGLT